MTITELTQLINQAIMFLNNYEEDHDYNNLIRVFSILSDINAAEITL